MRTAPFTWDALGHARPGSQSVSEGAVRCKLGSVMPWQAAGEHLDCSLGVASHSRSCLAAPRVRGFVPRPVPVIGDVLSVDKVHHVCPTIRVCFCTHMRCCRVATHQAPRKWVVRSALHPSTQWRRRHLGCVPESEPTQSHGPIC